MAIVIEDGTGVEGAEAYDATSVVAAWLVLRGLTAFSALGSDDREVKLRVATEYAEDYVRGHLGGYPTTTTQGLQFPRSGCYLRDGRMLENDDIPRELKEAIRLLCEDAANGRLGVTAATGMRTGIVSVSEDGDSVTFAQGGQRPGLASVNAGAARKLDMLVRGRSPWEG